MAKYYPILGSKPTEMERVTFVKFSIAHKLQVVSLSELSNEENANAVAAVRSDSSLKGQNRSKFKGTS